MTRVKNATGGSGGDDDGRRHPSILELLKGKGKGVQKKTSKKRKLSPGSQRALAVAQAAERTERGGRRAGVTIREIGSSAAQQSVEEDEEMEEQLLEQQEQPHRRSSRV
jgi:hypothetical protein